MEVTIRRSSVAGTARAPASKSYTHRAILSMGFADGGRITEPLVSADTRATVGAIEAFGAAVEPADGTFDVTGFGGRPGVPADVIDCANSGTTMRLMTATAALADGTTVLTGDDSLRSRPQGPLLAAIDALGGRARSTRENGQAPLVVDGPIHGGTVTIPGDVSSQFVTALLMAGPVTEDGIEVVLETELKSAPYVEVTRDVLDAFGIETEATGEGFRTPGGQRYAIDRPYGVPGDFSSMSYLLAAGAVAGDDVIVVRGATPSAQGDAVIVDRLEEMGAAIDWDRAAGEIRLGPSALEGTTVDVGDTPDLLPTLAVLGAVAGGTTRLVNAEHVRYKETDRVDAMATELSKLGAVVEDHPDELVVHGGDTRLTGARVDGRRDHRVIMALAVAGLVAEGATTIAGAEHVDVSFPGFFERFAELGAAVDRG